MCNLKLACLVHFCNLQLVTWIDLSVPALCRFATWSALMPMRLIYSKQKEIFLWSFPQLNINIKLDSLRSHLKVILLSLSSQYKQTHSFRCRKLSLQTTLKFFFVPIPGKTVLMGDKLLSLSDDYMVANVPFNFYTTSEMLQRVLEKPLEKKAGRNYGPPGTKRLIYFIDDMNMPEVDQYFTVQPHTLIRQHIDYSHWYDRTKLTLKDIHNTQYVSCMNPTAGSFTINPRLQVSIVYLCHSVSPTPAHWYAWIAIPHIKMCSHFLTPTPTPRPRPIQSLKYPMRICDDVWLCAVWTPPHNSIQPIFFIGFGVCVGLGQCERTISPTPEGLSFTIIIMIMFRNVYKTKTDANFHWSCTHFISIGLSVGQCKWTIAPVSVPYSINTPAWLQYLNDKTILLIIAR